MIFKKTVVMISLIPFLILPISATESAMERLNKLTNKRLVLVHPDLQKAYPFIKRQMERAFPQYKLQVLETFRPCEEQMRLWRIGRNKFGNIDNNPKTKIVTKAKCGGSLHQYFWAMDLLPYRQNGQPEWNDWEFWKKLKAVVVSLGLVSGADFKGLGDWAHVELSASAANIKKLCGKRGCDPEDIALLPKPKMPNSKQKVQNAATEKSKTPAKPRKSGEKIN
jgi:D-alanyl-D-alanine carboxypeptidase